MQTLVTKAQQNPKINYKILFGTIHGYQDEDHLTDSVIPFLPLPNNLYIKIRVA